MDHTVFDLNQFWVDLDSFNAIDCTLNGIFFIAKLKSFIKNRVYQQKYIIRILTSDQNNH